jgi:membrane protease YdiL (CAAX protease family)
MGLRLDNLRTALPVYLAASLIYAGLVLALLNGLIEVREPRWPEPGKLLWRLGWAFTQEFCLLTFLLTRLRRLMSGDYLAMVAAAGIFAFFHLPNPFLTLYTLGGGLLAAWLYRRHPSLVAATVAHVAAAALVAWLLPTEVTGGMRVGPVYWLLR